MHEFSEMSPTLSKDISALRKYFLINIFFNISTMSDLSKKHVSRCVDTIVSSAFRADG